MLRRGMMSQVIDWSADQAGLSARQTVVHRIWLLGRQPGSDLTHDRNDPLHDITADAVGVIQYRTTARIVIFASSWSTNSQSSRADIDLLPEIRSRRRFMKFDVVGLALRQVSTRVSYRSSG